MAHTCSATQNAIQQWAAEKLTTLSYTLLLLILVVLLLVSAPTGSSAEPFKSDILLEYSLGCVSADYHRQWMRALLAPADERAKSYLKPEFCRDISGLPFTLLSRDGILSYIRVYYPGGKTEELFIMFEAGQ